MTLTLHCSIRTQMPGDDDGSENRCEWETAGGTQNSSSLPETEVTRQGKTWNKTGTTSREKSSFETNQLLKELLPIDKAHWNPSGGHCSRRRWAPENHKDMRGRQERAVLPTVEPSKARCTGISQSDRGSASRALELLVQELP